MQSQDFWSRFHRRFHFHFDSIGIWFDYKGDEVAWMYPWKRNSRHKYLSLCFEAGFNSLKEMDEAWKEYFMS